MTTPVSTTIYASRDAIRTQVVDFLQQYMELNEVDLTQSSFLSYMIDILTTLSSNLMFYQTNIYREFFLTQAQLPESIHNLSSFLGYSPKEAEYAICNVLVTINFPFNDPDTVFNIKEGFEFTTSDGISFITYYTTTINVTNNTSVSITTEQDGKIYNLPVSIITDPDLSYFQFLLPVRQYKSTVQEFTIDSDLQLFQFTDINVPFDGKLASMVVYVRDPDSSSEDTGRLYTQFNSLYLMSNSDYGYVVRVSSDGRKLYFGNGIIGQQPLAGSTVIVYTNLTEGSDGNVISGSITSGGRIYSQQGGETTVVNYTVINPSPAYSGEDEEDLQEIRNNSIKSLTSLNRLVSEQDYKNFDVVIPDAPIYSNSIPVLKRSDLKINEIQLYTILKFGDEIVPTKNASYPPPDATFTLPSTTTYIPRETTINIDGTDYITLFEMTLESQNESAYYHYIMRQIEIVPTLIQSWTDELQDLYHFHTNNLVVIAGETTPTATFELSYYSNESDFDLCECVMSIESTGDEYIMTNDPGTGGGTFTCEFTDYLDIPAAAQTYYFTISNPSLPIQQLISQYSVNFTFRKDLKSYMISNTIDDGTNTVIYDIPVILKSYYESLEDSGKVTFETQVLQSFLSSFSFKNYRMLTDFINIKFCNTTGKSKNMLLNTPTKNSITAIGLTYIPVGSIGDSYIVSGNEGGVWDDHKNEIALCVDDITNEYVFSSPKDNDIVYVENKGTKYIYSELGWRKPEYEIPLKIVIEVFKVNDSSIDEAILISEIKSTIIDYYEDLFGSKIDIRRSKIIDLVHNIDGVSHCRLIKPQSGIFFNFDIDEFNQQELMEYSPEWIYFTEDDITVRIFTLE